jgi:hypothetical protein
MTISARPPAAITEADAGRIQSARKRNIKAWNISQFLKTEDAGTFGLKKQNLFIVEKILTDFRSHPRCTFSTLIAIPSSSCSAGPLFLVGTARLASGAATAVTARAERAEHARSNV